MNPEIILLTVQLKFELPAGCNNNIVKLDSYNKIEEINQIYKDHLQDLNKAQRTW